VTKRPHFAEQEAGHHKCPKIMQQKIQISLKSQLDIANVLKNPVAKHPHVAKQPAGHHKWVQKFCDKSSKFRFRKGWTKMSQSILRRVDIMSHVTNRPP
jgi:hypothetical protein